MARKNGNGEGSRPRERADGRWEARYWVGGKRRSVYGSTRKEAADKLAKAIANNAEPRATLVATNITVREFFAQYDEVVRNTMKRRSLETYRGIRENLEDLRRRALLLKVVEHLDQHGGQAAVDYLTDTEPAELDRVWLDEDIPTFRQYLRRRCGEALAAVEEGRAA